MDGRSPPWRVRYALGFLCPPKLELHTTALFRVWVGWLKSTRGGEAGCTLRVVRFWRVIV